jgi:integrase
VAHIQKRCQHCGGTVPPRARTCPSCSADGIVWRARYRAPDGRERSKTFQRRPDAERFITTVEGRKLRREWTDPQLARTRYGDWLLQWLKTERGLRPSTKARDDSYFTNYILPRFRQVPVGAIEQLDARGWVADLSASGLAAATVRKAYQLFAKTMQAAVDSGLIPRTPCRGITLPRVEAQEMRFLTPGQIARLADVIEPRYRALVLLGAYGGLRIGELAGLRPARVDLLRGRIEVAEILVEVRGTLHIGPPKTRASRRTIGLPHPLVAVLAEHLERFAGPDLFFPAPEGGPLRASLFRRRSWQPAVARAGLPHIYVRAETCAECRLCDQPKGSPAHHQPLRIHDLRHTAVALWIAAGANPKEVAARAGHTSVAFTFDCYGHLFPDSDELLRDRLGEMFDRSAEEPRGAVVAISR